MQSVAGRDGRAFSAEPVTAFEAHLDELGHGRFRIWWTKDGIRAAPR